MKLAENKKSTKTLSLSVFALCPMVIVLEIVRPKRCADLPHATYLKSLINFTHVSIISFNCFMSDSFTLSQEAGKSIAK